MMKKTKLLILLSVAMLSMGKANLCSNTYATDGNHKMNELKLDEDASKENSKALAEENVDKNEDVLTGKDIEKKKKLITSFINKLKRCNFLDDGITVSDEMINKVKLNDFKIIYDNLSNFYEKVLGWSKTLEETHVDLVEKNDDNFIENILQFAKEEVGKCMNNLTDLVESFERNNSALFDFKFSGKFLDLLRRIFSGSSKDARLESKNEFEKFTLDVSENMSKFIFNFTEFLKNLNSEKEKTKQKVGKKKGKKNNDSGKFLQKKTNRPEDGIDE